MATTPGNSINESTTGICGFTGTAFTGTAVTNHAVLVGGSTSSTLTNLSVGATGTVLRGVTGSDPSFTAAPTVTSITLSGGTALGTFIQGAWTPGISFGGGTTGITYTTQLARYTQIGNVVTFSFFIILTSKGSSTGVAAITGLPVTVGGGFSGANIIESNRLTLDLLYTWVTMEPLDTTSTAGIFENGSAQSPVNITDTAFANNSQIRGSGIYFTS